MHFGVKEHLTTIFRHWVKIVLVIFGALLVTGAMAFLSSKVYVSEARILILNSSPAERAARSTFSESGGAASPQEQVLTQVQIIKSPALAEKLALQLGPQRVVDEMSWRWDWLREIPGEIKDRIVGSLYGWGPTADILRAIGIRDPNLFTGEAGPPLGAARDKIMDALIAEGIIKTDMFGVAFQAPSPDFAADALNAMIDIYVGHVVGLRRPVDTAAIAQQEAERLEVALGVAEEELRVYARTHDILSIDRQKDLLLDRWSRTQEELAQARRDAGEINTRLTVTENQIATLPRNEAITTTTRPNPVADSLRERLVQLQTESQRYVEGSAAAVRLQREIESVSSQLEREAQAVSGAETVGASSLYQELNNRITRETADREAVDVRISFLENQLKSVEDELRRVDSHELQYRQLARAVEAKEEAYRYALQKREETAIQTQIDQPSLAQVVPVEQGNLPEDPSSPQRARLLVLGIIAGTMAGIGMAYILEFARRTVSTEREAEMAVGLPVLVATERFGLLSRRMKRTRLELRRFAVWIGHQRRPDTPLRLLLSSAHRRSGQSSLVTELARSLQQQGAHVLSLRLELNERAAETGEIKPVKGAAGDFRNELVVIRAPAWEMARRVHDLLEPEAGTGPSHEVVLVDAPDILRFPEQGSLVELTDLVVPVIEAERTRLPEIREQLDDLRAMEAQVPGIALTKRRQSRSSWAFSWMAMTQRKAGERAV